MKSHERNNYDPNDNRHEDDEHESGRECQKQLINLVDACPICLSSPVEGAVWYGKLQILRCSGTHLVGFFSLFLEYNKPGNITLYFFKVNSTVLQPFHLSEM